MIECEIKVIVYFQYSLSLFEVWAARYWQQKGCPKHKLLIGFSAQTPSFDVTNPKSHGLGAPALYYTDIYSYPEVSLYI